MGNVRRCYGGGPLHLLLLVACFGFTGYVLTRVDLQGGLVRIGLWFVCALLLHDLILWPAYALADRIALRAARRRTPLGVPWINHVRVPTIISGVLLGISFPLVLGLSATAYERQSGVSETPYLYHWLSLVAILFGASALIYALRLVRAALVRRKPTATTAPTAAG